MRDCYEPIGYEFIKKILQFIFAKPLCYIFGHLDRYYYGGQNKDYLGCWFCGFREDKN